MKKLCLILGAALLLGGCNRLDNHQPLSTAKLSFMKVQEITQTFTSHHAGLNIVSICIRNPNRALVPLYFELRDGEGLVVRSLHFNGGNIDNEDCTRFQFAPVAESRDKTYTAAIIRPPETEPESNRSEAASLYIEGHGGGDYREGVASLDGQETPYDLHFKTAYKQGLKELLQESVQQFFVRLTKDPIFFLLLVSGLGGIIWQLRHRA